MHTNLVCNNTFNRLANSFRTLISCCCCRWGWNVNERGWINFPDVQTRIYKNIPEKIGWYGDVHERIVGFESYTAFPAEEVYCIKHPKTIERQERQNNYYDTL